MLRVLATAALALAATAEAGMPFTFPGMPSARRKPNPAVAALADYSAVLHTNLGDLTVRLDAEDAPNAVRNFIKLAQQGLYDGSRITCIFKDRMLVAGDPTGTGKGDSGTTLPFERSFERALAGSLALDRRPDEPDPDAKGGKPRRVNSGSRILILLADQRHLDGDYTIFGAITDGLDVAKRLGAATTTPNDGRPAPVEDLVIERVTVKKPSPEPPQPAAKAAKGG